MATIAKGSAQHIVRRMANMTLRHFAVKYKMTTRYNGHLVEGYDRASKRWVTLCNTLII
jgi:hypothetical protein